MADTHEDVLTSKASERTVHHPHLFIVLECDRPTSGGARFLLAGVDEVVIGRGLERASHREVSGGVVRLFVRVPGRSMSTSHARLQRSDDGWVIEDSGSTNGSFVNRLRVQHAVLRDGDAFELGHTLFFLRTALATPMGAAADLDSSGLETNEPGFSTLVPDASPHLVALSEVADSPMPILLLGATGTGKEVIARSLHQLSGRTGPFVAINCGALPPNLVESHLFGHVKGAFSGATRDELGAIRTAHQGTLLLDEVGDLPLVAQPALLRFLQQGEVTAVGTARAEVVDVRVIAATHLPLAELVASGQFREDLFMRLNGFTHTLPALRHRREDLGLIVADILRKTRTGSIGVSIAPSAGSDLLAYDWPGNVRELEQSLLRALALSNGPLLEPCHFRFGAPSDALRPHTNEPVEMRGLKPLSMADAKLRKELLVQLEKHGGRISDVAKTFGKGRMQIHRWMKRFGIKGDMFKR